MYCCPCVVCVSASDRVIVKEVIEVDELDEGSTSAAAGKQDEYE